MDVQRDRGRRFDPVERRGIIVGADIVEHHPGRDIGDVTAILGAKLVRELAALIDRNGIYKT